MAAEQAKNALEIVKKYETFLDSILKRLARRRGIYYTLRAAFVGSEGDYKEAEMREVLERPALRHDRALLESLLEVRHLLNKSHKNKHITSDFTRLLILTSRVEKFNR